MSSPSNKPYKSRLLNLINSYYIKFNSQVNVKFREFGYVIQGALQKAVLPFFWLWQSSNKIGRVFSSSSNSDSSLPSGDRDNISVQTHRANYLIEAVNKNLSSNPLFTSLLPENFQGLASRLNDQYIVVIVDNNKIKDIIPKIKQEDIKFLIKNTIKNHQNTNLFKVKAGINKINQLLSFFKRFSTRRKYISNNNLLLANQQEESPLSSNSSESIIFSPEKGKIISAVDNLFSRFEGLIIKNNQQSDLHTNKQAIEKLIDKLPNGSHDSYFYLLIQNAIDYFFVNNKNENKILSASELQHKHTLDNYENNKRGKQKQLSGHNQPQYVLPTIKNKVVQDIIETSNHKLQEVLPIVKETTSKIVLKGVEQLQVATNNLNKSIEEDPFQIRVLIVEAINYFFNDKNNKNNFLKSQMTNKLLANFTQKELINIDEQLANDWLSWEDLYGNQKSLPCDDLKPIYNTTNTFDKVTEDSIQLRQEIPNIKDISSINHGNGNIDKSNREIVTSKISILPPKVTETHQVDTLNIVNQLTEQTAIEIVQEPKNVTVEKTKKEASNYDRNRAIEAKVIEIKYEKHLLVIILEKLDQLIVWLEEKIIKLIAIIKVLITKISANKN